MTSSETTHQDAGEKLGALVSKLMTLVNRRSAGQTLEIMSEAGLTLPQMVALHILRFAGPMPITGLVEGLRLSTSATSHLVDRMHEKGLVSRDEDPTDRRQKRVALTDAGGALLDRLNDARATEWQRGLEGLDARLAEQLIGVFERVITELEATNGEVCVRTGKQE